MIIKVKKEEKLLKALIHNIQGLSFGLAQKYLRLGKIKVNGKRMKDNISLQINDEIDIFINSTSKPNVDILYQDENVIIVNKPQGMECATRDKSSQNTYSLEEIFADQNAIVVHRLDRLTEGIVILARTKEVAKKFETYFEKRLIDKSYMAYVHGVFKEDGIKHAYLKKNEKKSIVEISDEKKDGFKEIITEFSLIKSNDKFSLLDIRLHTGRTHQIRAHLSHLGYPIVNDSKYSKLQGISDYKGYFLTAYKIKFHLEDNMKYLNDLDIEIKPTWLDIIKK